MIAQWFAPRPAQRLRFREDAQLVARVQATSHQMQSLTDLQLRQFVEQLRESVLNGTPVDDPAAIEAGFALVNESLRRTFGHHYYDVQLTAGLVLTRGGIAEMATGEGKTFTAALPAFMHALRGRGVHIASANAYLAERDQQKLAPLFERLGLTCGHAADQAPPDKKRPAYEADITYATGHEFGFDYLRDQVAMRQNGYRPLGQDFLNRYRQAAMQRRQMQRGLAFAIIDEADNILLDDAVSPLLLSEATGKTAPDATLYQLAIKFAAELTCGDHFHLDPATRQLWLLPAGIAAAHAHLDSLPTELLQHPWTQYVEQALKACHVMQRDVHYVLVDGEVQIVDESTGRIFTDRSWRDGLHQAVEAREGVNVTCEKQALARITRQRFYRLYAGLCGMTGTATGSEREFHLVYNVGVSPVPLRCPSQRRILPARYFPSQGAKWEAIAVEIATRHATGQPILLGTRTIGDSLQVASLLESRQIPFQLLNGRQDKDEAEIISAAGQRGAVTIATNLAGRGTDIKLSAESLAVGGLHVIAAERHASHRIDRQLLGRCARQGDPGSAQFFVSAEDDLPARESPRLAREIRRLTQRSDCAGRFDLPLNRLQNQLEQKHAAQRRAMLLGDLERDTVVAKLWGEN